jgi:hypothetical protein
MFAVRKEWGSTRHEMTCGFILMVGCHADVASLHFKIYKVHDPTYVIAEEGRQMMLCLCI